MAKLVIRRFLGRSTAENQLDAEKGAMAVTRNCALTRPGLLVCRNGLATHSTDTVYKNTHALWEYDSTKMKHADDNAGAYAILRWTGAAWSSVLASAQHTDGANFPLHVVETQDALFVAEGSGVRRFETPTSTSGFAGMPKMPDMDRSNSTLTDNAAGILGAQKARAYRAVLEMRPTDGTSYRVSAPTGRLVLRNINAGGGSNQIPLVRVLLPKAVNTGSTALTTGNLWLSLYASSMTADLTEEPLEDYGLVYDYLLVAGDVTAGYVDITDRTPDALRGSALYTNIDQEGAAQAADPPPFIRCLTAYKGCLIGANTTTRQRFELQLLATDPAGTATAGVDDTDTLTVAQGATTVTITAKATPGASTDYKLENTGTVSKDIELTAQNICAAINRHASNTFCVATYAGVPGDPRSVGRLIIESRVANTDALDVYVGAGDQTTCWEPQLPAGGASAAIVSTEDEWFNGWAMSKRHQPDAWPLSQVGRLGNGNIIAVAALDDAVFFFHDSGEVWMGTGEPPGPNYPGTWRVELWRSNLTLLAPRSLAVLDGWLWALTDRGVVRMSPEGFQIMSGAIEPSLKADLLSSGATNLRQRAYAAVHPLERRYLLGLYVSSAYTFHVYNAQAADSGSTGWTSYVTDVTEPYAKMGAAYWSRDDDALYLGQWNGSNATIYYDSNGTGSDAFDDSGAAIFSDITTPPIVHGDGSVPKQLREVQAVFEGGQPTDDITATIETEHGTAFVSVPTQSTNVCRIPVPQSVQRGARHTVTLSISNPTSGSQWKLASMAFLYRPYQERPNK